MDVPVVLWDMGQREISDQEEYDLNFLENFHNLQDFVINFDSTQICDYTILKERIEEQVPDCEVYIVYEGEKGA